MIEKDINPCQMMPVVFLWWLGGEMYDFMKNWVFISPFFMFIFIIFLNFTPQLLNLTFFDYLHQFCLCLISKTSVRPYIGFKKFLVSVFLSVCDVITGAEIISFSWNLAQMFVLRKISCIVFRVHCPNSTYTGIHKNFSVHNGQEGKFFKINFDMTIVHNI